MIELPDEGGGIGKIGDVRREIEQAGVAQALRLGVGRFDLQAVEADFRVAGQQRQEALGGDGAAGIIHVRGISRPIDPNTQAGGGTETFSPGRTPLGSESQIRFLHG